jgi:hypothetical protein
LAPVKQNHPPTRKILGYSFRLGGRKILTALKGQTGGAGTLDFPLPQKIQPRKMTLL